MIACVCFTLIINSMVLQVMSGTIHALGTGVGSDYILIQDTIGMLDMFV